MDIEKLIKELTIEEKIALVAGTDFFYTNPIPNKGIKSFAMSDGPHGLRYQRPDAGIGLARSYPSTAFPTAVSLASSWNVDNMRLVGAAIAAECKHYGVGLLLGPGVNIKRNPLCGRNFEYFSEDPVLTAKLAASQINALQDNNVGSTVKHYALNNSENYRFMSNSIADTRAIRELYLKQFEIINKSSNPAAIMTSYNMLDGVYASENKYLIQDILRNEWKYDGLVMTDWGAIHNRCKSLNSGLDLEMPGDTKICRKSIMDGIKSKELSIETLDDSVRRVLNLITKYDNEKSDVDFEKNHKLSGQIAADSAVLLKNEGVLPLSTDDKILVIGNLFNNMRYQGAGSSMIEPTMVTTPKMSFDSKGINYEFELGYYKNSINNDLINQAIDKAKDYSKILYFIGLTDEYETEGRDRKTLSLPENQIMLMKELVKLNKEIILVLFSGSVVDLSPFEQAKAILYMGLPGQNGGSAVASLLFGDTSPSGRLAETWIKSIHDIPFIEEYSNSVQEIYKESIYVGYRYYTTFNIPVRYPFGYGLSYSSFDYSNLKITNDEQNIYVYAEIKNTGEIKASEVIEVFIEHKSKIFAPKRELKAFTKVLLDPHEAKEVHLCIPINDLKYFNIKEDKFILDGGEYIIQICKDANTVILSNSLELKKDECIFPYEEAINEKYISFNNISNKDFELMSGKLIKELPAKKVITMDSRFTDLKQTLLGKIIFNAVMSLPRKDRKKALKAKDEIERENRLRASEFLKDSLESNSLNGMSMGSSGKLQYNQAEALMHFANYRLIKGVRSLFKSIKAPKLPKDN